MFNRLFNPDNIVMHFLSRIFDLVVLNFIFFVCCLPVFTIGASLSALYYVSLKMVKNEDGYIVKTFFRAFKDNFKQSTVLWILIAVVGVFLRIDFTIVKYYQNTSAVFQAVYFALVACSIVLLCIYIYIFPVLSHFVCTMRQALKNSVLLAFGFFPYTLIMLAIHGVVLFLLTFHTATFQMIIALAPLCLFSVISFTCCIFFRKIFSHFSSEEKPEETALS